MTYRRSSSKLLPLNETNYDQLNLTVVENIEKIGFNNLPELLVAEYQHKHTYFNSGDIVTTNIKLIDVNNLLLTITQNDSIISTDTLTGKIKRNRFYINKQRYKDLSEGQFFFSIVKSKTRIGITKQKNLTLDDVTQFMIRLFYIPVVIEEEHLNDIIYRAQF